MSFDDTVERLALQSLAYWSQRTRMEKRGTTEERTWEARSGYGMTRVIARLSRGEVDDLHDRDPGLRDLTRMNAIVRTLRHDVLHLMGLRFHDGEHHFAPEEQMLLRRALQADNQMLADCGLTEYSPLLLDSVTLARLQDRVAFLESSEGITELMDRCVETYIDSLSDETGNARMTEDDKNVIMTFEKVNTLMLLHASFRNKRLPPKGEGS
mgnify:CR=1 FL=1